MRKIHTARHLALRLLFVLTIVTIAGCLVDEDSEETLIGRSTATLRTITGGEYFDYLVFGQITTSVGTFPQTFEGTLNVSYYVDTLPNPFIGGTVPGLVIREVSTLTLGATVYTLTRFLQQDLNGSIYVLAVRNGGAGSTIYRAGENNDLSNPHAINIFPSPVLTTPGVTFNNIDYQYLQGCESPATSCSSVVQTINDTSLTYQGDAEINTFDGKFQALRIDYDGLFLGPMSPSTPALFDLRGACDNNNATFFGSTYVFPEVGVVFMENSCSIPGGGGHRYTASLVNTNVVIP